MRLATRLIPAVAGMFALSMTMMSCSSSDSGSPTAPTSPQGETIDEIVVNLESVAARYDCDFDPVGVTAPGEFYFVLNVDTLSDNGAWAAVSKNKEKYAKINTGSSNSPSGQSASVRLVRREGQAFRVRMSIREADVGGNDFSSSNSVTHQYRTAATQLYQPTSGPYSKWDAVAQSGNMTWSINKRDRQWVAGVLVGEGCQVSMTYSVFVKTL